ncbi:uncharacterized protein LOC121397217 isoform X1 [Xenopus laevis]|uniref:Uncharacterized protein LOC121397217 isoform X1 n=1 Tax=Xenopus laevis TaxID=8355 RepID=A0A8J1LJ57_XENLA|nr:uncharacterized protein LOC121397217 isoform X1 [Xenopus laevis]XP_041429553.1 uncharacterized protein LOC121397217 isoform X1 [Xenopus laevis]
MNPLYRSLVLFILLKLISPESLCSWEIQISVGEGRDVILPVNNPKNRIFSWRFDTGNFFESFAKTEAGGKKWDIKDQFRGRLSSTENGSLIITNVTMKDRQNYFEWPEVWTDCIQKYFLLISSNFPEKNPIVRHKESIVAQYFCVPGIEISVGEGEEVILPVLSGETFDWRFDNGYQYKQFAKTEAGGKIWDIKDQFRGRLSSTENGSLIITNVTMNDPPTYVKWLDQSQWPDCIQKYYLRVYKPLEAEDILIHHNITGKGTCNITLTCAVTQSQVTVSWDETNQRDTEVEGDTLHIYNVKSTVTYTCTAQNPISRTSKSINPWHLCYKGAEPTGASSATVASINENVLKENQIRKDQVVLKENQIMKDQGVQDPDLGKI